MLGNYLQQTTSADDIFRCIFLGALRVNNIKQSTAICSIKQGAEGSKQNEASVAGISREEHF